METSNIEAARFPMTTHASGVGSVSSEHKYYTKATLYQDGTIVTHSDVVNNSDISIFYFLSQVQVFDATGTYLWGEPHKPADVLKVEPGHSLPYDRTSKCPHDKLAKADHIQLYHIAQID